MQDTRMLGGVGHIRTNDEEEQHAHACERGHAHVPPHCATPHQRQHLKSHHDVDLTQGVDVLHNKPVILASPKWFEAQRGGHTEHTHGNGLQRGYVGEVQAGGRLLELL